MGTREKGEAFTGLYRTHLGLQSDVSNLHKKYMDRTVGFYEQRDL
jgi:hypothetical protein